MPRSPPRRKRKVETEDVVVEDVKESEDESSSSIGESMNEEDVNMEEIMASPSPIAKKDMFLRSGKRKRRRSKETSGLTPPEQVTAKKKARKSMPTTDNKNSSNNKLNKEASQEVVVESDDNESLEEAKFPATAAKKGRNSLLLTDHNALAAAQEPQLSTTSNVEVDDEGRRLFDGRPPSMPVTMKSSTATKTRRTANESSDNKQTTTTTTTQVYQNGIAPEVEIPAPSSRYGRILLLFFLLLFSPLFYKLWPMCVRMTEFVIPLKESEFVVLSDKLEDIVAVTEEAPELQVSSVILEGLESLQLVQNSLDESSKDLAAKKANLDAFMANIKKHADVSKRKMMIRFSRLAEAETTLMRALKEEDLTTDAWMDARETVDALGSQKKLIDTSVVDLWHVDNPVKCSETIVIEDDDPVLDSKFFLTAETNLLLRAAMSGEKIVKSKEAEANIRAWVRDQIDASIDSDPATVQGLETLNAPTSQEDGLTYLDNVEDLIQGRLEMELADGTGLFDHASHVNGAKVIYGGSRGTTKSLVDSLPLYNRLMQLGRLRFYGYGPEAAITPTYPRHALGQCWSFQQMPVKEQLKRSRLQKDDHKHGNFGTLTISLPMPLRITKVSIEHPPDTITDHRNGAVRSFRIMAYEDAMASWKSWSLGSFEYDIAKGALQEFDVSTDMFGNIVPEMQSISLAIDSNWGLEYSCLYRFRVHGDAIGFDESSDDDDDSDD